MLFLLLSLPFQCLRPALADVWKMCCQISATGLCHIEQKHTYTLWDFQDTQVKQLQKVPIAVQRKTKSGLLGFTLAQIRTEKVIKKKMITKAFVSYYILKCVEPLHGHAFM